MTNGNNVMKNVLKSRFLWATALLICLGIAGCNIFNPTESVNITNEDADALTYEGYVKFQKNEYTEAAYYFERAIAADSSHSEAWFGLIKAKMNSEGLNAFKILKFANSKRDKSMALMDLSPQDSIYVVDTLEKAVDSIYVYANLFKQYDQEGKLDGVISLRNKSVADGYMVLHILNTMLTMRRATAKMSNCNNGQKCSVGDILNGAKRSSGEVVSAFNNVFETCAEDPTTMKDWFGQFITAWDTVDAVITEGAQTSILGALCESLAEETNSDNEDDQQKAINNISSQFGYSDLMDDDGDGCIDEEVFDGVDNDGDGEVDEDTRDKTISIEYDKVLISQNMLQNKKSKKDLLVISSTRPTDKYLSLDIDMDGRIFDEEEYTDEWEFVYRTFKEREKNQNHLFKFAQNIHFNYNPGDPASVQNFWAAKKAIAKDTDPNAIQYDLRARQEIIGGCWVNYTDEDFEELKAKWAKMRME
jgi:tetratricopeptide (TPR) repeat protein